MKQQSEEVHTNFFLAIW